MIVITPGDPNGVGPEVTIKALKVLRKQGWKNSVTLVGASEPFLKAKFKDPHSAFISAPRPSRGKKLNLAGFQSGWSIQMAVDLIARGNGTALVTGPISKENLNAGGFNYPGHTEFLAHLTGKKRVTMMLANSIFRVSLVTVHQPLSAVAKSITIREIQETLQDTCEGLQKIWAIKKPRIAVLGVNPHAGEGGLLGKEEIDVIRPSILSFQKSRPSLATIEGPFPADSFFGLQLTRKVEERYDAIVSMYHDQGLIPVKLVDFQKTVNITLGLPFLRTSVDHGCAFDIAGKGIADPSSMIEALLLASRQ